MSTICIRNGTILTMNEQQDILQADLLIEDGVIKTIGRLEQVADILSIDAAGKLITPSFYNMHVHLGETIFRGYCDGCDLWQYLEISHGIYHNRNWMAQENKIHRLSGLITIYESIKNGVGYICCNRGWEEVKDSKIKADCLFPIVNIDKLKSFYNGLTQFYDVKRQYQSNQCNTDLFLQSLYLCEAEKLDQIAEMLKDNPELRLFVHVSETLQEVAYCKERYNLSPIQVLKKYGLLTKQTFCVHAVYLEEEDYDLLKETRAHVILCPVSNLKLKDGEANPLKLLQKGISPIVATDGFATNNSASILEELKVMGICNHGKIACEDLLSTITKNPAEALQEEGYTGTIEEGVKANISIFHTDDYLLSDKKHIINNLIYNFTAFHCETVISEGRPLMRNHLMETFDFEKAKQEYTVLLRELYQDEGGIW